LVANGAAAAPVAAAASFAVAARDRAVVAAAMAFMLVLIAWSLTLSRLLAQVGSLHAPSQ
jgi:hypothetical protein